MNHKQKKTDDFSELKISIPNLSFFYFVIQVYQQSSFSPGPLVVINFQVGIERDN